ncbi:DNA-binding protein [Umbelopsis sp. PMI_123]|nr:DNA-binding protein [Umbelopsis sp. PMI_123]
MEGSTITLDGSIALVVEFFNYSVNSILFQRAVYPPEEFTVKKKYGLNILMTINDELQLYMKQVCSQLQEWLTPGKISKLVLVIKDKDTTEVVERWQFDIHVHDNSEQTQPIAATSKLQEDIYKEIQAIMRQITASVTFLPVLEDKCTFNILVYADEDIQVPTTWEDSDPNLIAGGGEHVKLRSFDTSMHKIDALVAYRVTNDV